MIVGRFLGDLPNLTPWIFMATAGVFLYVALVDMIPELNSGHSHPYTSEEHHESKATELCLQVSFETNLFPILCTLPAHGPTMMSQGPLERPRSFFYSF